MRRIIPLLLILLIVLICFYFYSYNKAISTTETTPSTLVHKPSIGLIQGNGEPSLADLQQVNHFLSERFTIENLYLDTQNEIPNRFKSLIWIAPTKIIAPTDLAKVKSFYQKGGKLVLALNQVIGNLTTFEGRVQTTGIQEWLTTIGINIENSFLVDKVCSQVVLPHLENGLLVNSPIDFPFIPVINTYANHSITKDIGAIMFSFCSPINYSENQETIYTPLLFSSSKSGIITPPLHFDTHKNWIDSDFLSSELVLGAILDNTTTGSQIIIYGDGDFPVTGQLGGKHSDNIRLLVNSVNWLMQDSE